MTRNGTPGLNMWKRYSTGRRLLWAFAFGAAMLSTEVAAKDDPGENRCGDPTLLEMDASEVLGDAREAMEDQRFEAAATTYECYVFEFDMFDAQAWLNLGKARLALGSDYEAFVALDTACQLQSSRGCQKYDAMTEEIFWPNLWFRWDNVLTIADTFEGRRANVAMGVSWSPRTSVAMIIGQATRQPSDDAELVADRMLGAKARWEHPGGARLGGGGARGWSIDFAPRWRLYAEAGWKWNDVGVGAETRVGRLEYSEMGTTVISPSTTYSIGPWSVAGRYALGVDDNTVISHAMGGRLHLQADDRTAFELEADAGDRPDLLKLTRLTDAAPTSYYRIGLGGSRVLGSLIDVGLNLNYRRQREGATGPGIGASSDAHILELGVGMTSVGW